jgi:hypothetical protein
MLIAIIVASCLAGGIFIHSSCINKKETEKEALGPHPFDKSEKGSEEKGLKARVHIVSKLKHQR